MRLVIVGTSGMLGNYLKSYLSLKYETKEINRDNIDLSDSSQVITDYFINNVEKEDIIINAAGVTKHRDYSLKDMITVNSVFPHILNDVKKMKGCKVIHITTDCVFSGREGKYNELSLHDCFDDYGKSKSLGENSYNTNIRTSIIGDDLRNKRSLIEWVKSNSGKEINGYSNHLWNGVTCLQLTEFIDSMIASGTFWEGTRHIFSPQTISKYDLVKAINEIYNLQISINRIETKENCFRDLKSIYSDFSLITKDIRDQIIEQKNFGEKQWQKAQYTTS